MTDSEIQSVKLRFGIIGNSPQINNAIRVAMQVAPTDMTVLISGESGSGKESFSKIIHSLSPRKHGSFIAINCGAIPEGTIDSELFGHEKGAFTDAREMRKGYFEVTNGGTIFLDEIGEMPMGTQARLLRVLENGEFIKVGSSKVQKTDVRVVTATNVNLLDAVDKGKFREDLYYRLNTVPIFVPPLRERGGDIHLLFRKFATDFAERYRTKPLVLAPEAVEVLNRYRWPGNIRQLKNIVERISVLEMDREISSETLAGYIPERSSSNVPALFSGQGQSDDSFSEREILYKILFDMRKDVTDLKKLVHQLLKGGQLSEDLIEEHQDLFENLGKELPAAPSPKEELKPYLITGTPSTSATTATPSHHSPATDHEDSHYEEAKYEELDVEDEEESLSLEKKEREMIIKALRKNNNRRKYAARDLGISERTLYRKIKQYEIEE